MFLSQLEFTRIEGGWQGKPNATMAETWLNEVTGYRVYDDGSRTSDDEKMYWVIELNKDDKGVITEKVYGYQLSSFLIF
jgi:hypothetical protein